MSNLVNQTQMNQDIKQQRIQSLCREVEEVVRQANLVQQQNVRTEFNQNLMKLEFMIPQLEDFKEQLEDQIKFCHAIHQDSNKLVDINSMVNQLNRNIKPLMLQIKQLKEGLAKQKLTIFKKILNYFKEIFNKVKRTINQIFIKITQKKLFSQTIIQRQNQGRILQLQQQIMAKQMYLEIKKQQLKQIKEGEVLISQSQRILKNNVQKFLLKKVPRIQKLLLDIGTIVLSVDAQSEIMLREEVLY